MKHPSVLIALLLAFGLATERLALAQTNTACGLMVMAHGSDDEWNSAVEAAVKPLMDEIPTSIAYGMANPATMKAAISELEAQDVTCIAVVRLFMSAHSFLPQTEYLLGQRADPPRFFVTHDGHGNHGSIPLPLQIRAKVLISQEGLLDAPEMGSVLAENALAISDSSGTESAVIIAHGAGDDAVDAEWLQKLDRLADSVRTTGLFRSVAVFSLREDWLDKRAKVEEEIRDFVSMHSQDGGKVVVLPFRLFGFGPYGDVLHGMSYKSAGKGLLPSPQVTEWIRRITRDLIDQVHPHSDSIP